MTAPTNVLVHRMCSPELLLLAACSWLAPVGDVFQAELVNRRLDSEIRWDRFMDLVKLHRLHILAPMVLDRCGRGRVPVEVITPMRAMASRARLVALAHGAETRRIGEAFGAARLPVIFLKGPLLSQRLYQDPGLRQLKDLDLLIHQEDFPRAEELLGRLGYRRSWPPPGLAGRHLQYFLQESNGHAFEYLHDSTGLQVELHWRYGQWKTEDLPLAWNRARAVPWHGSLLATMDPELEFLYLCDHGAEHAWHRIKWLGDIAAILTRLPPGGSQSLMDLAKRLDVERPLGQALVVVANEVVQP